LCRKVGQKIVIGKDIFLTVVDNDRGKVRIGIKAPKEHRIYRTELLDDDRKDSQASE